MTVLHWIVGILLLISALVMIVTVLLQSSERSGLGLRFCHPSRFLVTADDKQTAIEACRRALRAAGKPVSE